MAKEAHGETFVSWISSTSSSSTRGIKFTMKHDAKLYYATKPSYCEAKTGKLTDENLITLKEGTFINNKITFDSYQLKANTTYYLLGGSDESWKSDRTEGTSFPIQGTVLTWVAGRGTTADDSDNIYVYESLNIGEDSQSISTIGTRGIRKGHPNNQGLFSTQSQEGRTMNLVPENSNIKQRNRKGL
jgi:hypothetical protein